MKITLDEGAYMPVRAHATDAGLDLFAREDYTIFPCGSVIIDTGVHIELPPNTYGKIESKSGLNVNHDIVSCGGVIDEGYVGSIKVKLYNLNHSDLFQFHGTYHIHKGDKIAQLVIMPCLYESCEVADSLDETERGSNGFGSTDGFKHSPWTIGNR